MADPNATLFFFSTRLIHHAIFLVDVMFIGPELMIDSFGSHVQHDDNINIWKAHTYEPPKGPNGYPLCHRLANPIETYIFEVPVGSGGNVWFGAKKHVGVCGLPVGGTTGATRWSELIHLGVAEQ